MNSDNSPRGAADGRDPLPQSRVEYAYSQIKGMIFSRQLRQGDAVVERQICEQLHLSKSPVREAIRQLSAEGLISLSGYQSAVVMLVTNKFIDDVFAARLLVEPDAVGAASLSAGQEAVAKRASAILDEAHEALEREDRVELGRLNRAFHAALYQDCGNGVLVAFLASLTDRTRLISVTSWEVEPTYWDEHSEHREILAAFAAGDEAACKKLLATHIKRFWEQHARRPDEPAALTRDN